jgi:Mobilization protein NikA
VIAGERHMKLASRTKSVGTKVTETEYARLEVCASEQGLSISEWCRNVLLEKSSGDRPREPEKITLAEILALRTILLNLHFAVARAETITADAMQAIIERADRDKARKAMERLGVSVGESGGET